MSNKSFTIFEDMSMKVDASKSNTKSIKKQVLKSKLNKLEISVKDAFKMLAGYQISSHNIAPLREKTGKCIICGKDTNSEMRNICFDCHDKHIKNIYDNAMKSLEEKKESFTYEW